MKHLKISADAHRGSAGSPLTLRLCTLNCGDAEKNISSARKTPANSPMASLLSRSARCMLLNAFIWFGTSRSKSVFSSL
jgi:hypothetical protein